MGASGQAFVQSRAPSRFKAGASAGRVAQMAAPLHDACALQAIPEGAAGQGARDMRAIQRLAGSKHDARAHWRRAYAQRVHTLARLWNFATTLNAPARFTLPQSLLRECPAAPGSEASAAAVARPQALFKY